MKKFSNGAVRHKMTPFAIQQKLFSKYYSFILPSFLFVTTFFMAGCQKENVSNGSELLPSITSAATVQSNPLTKYENLPATTAWELQQARAASAKYQLFDNAIKDGYVDINVIVPEMGYHYLKMDNLDLTFDYTKPEILVYNKNSKGTMELVAVEYAVPISLSPNTAPEGFTGNADVWDRNTYFGLWLLHAWVWSYNPNGVFNPTNPLVHVD